MQYEKQVRLKDGSACLLRHPTAADAQAILFHMILTSGESDNMLRYPAEITMTKQQEAAYLQRIADSENALMVAAVVNGKIVANAGFDPVAALDKCRHRAQLGISIQMAYWGLGIGSHIMSALLSPARQAGYTQLELDVVTDNTRAIALYEKCGFEIVGTNARAFRLHSGAYQATHLMTRPLD